MAKPSAPVPPPPLTRWQFTWRNLAAVAIAAFVWGNFAGDEWNNNRMLFWLDLALGLTAMVAMQYRRRWPLLVVLFILGVGTVSASSFGPGTVAFISMATRRRWREILPAAALNLFATGVFINVQPVEGSSWLIDLVLTLLATAVTVAIGMYIGARRELIATLHDRAERAEREQSMRVAQARLSERARIAREMHDALAHRMSLVAMHAGALTYRTDLSAEETTETAKLIQASAHRALTDLREILGVLRESESDGTPEPPQPTLDDLAALVEDERRAGGHVRLLNSIDATAEVPESIGRSAYRMVQECLTNARKHAPDTTVEIELSGSPGDRLVLTVRNPLRVGATVSQTPGAGLGLLGLTERVALSGGHLEHQLTREGDFVVRAWLPWPR